MASTGKGKNKKKGKTIDLNSFLADGENTPAPGFALANTTPSWADQADSDDETSNTYLNRRIYLPTAPKSARGPDVDISQLPNDPPFRAFLANVPYDVEEEDIAEFFKNLSLKQIRLPREGGDGGRLKGFAIAEFEDRQSLWEALSLSNETIKNRPIRVAIADSQDNERDRGHRSEDRPDRTPDDWRSAPREDSRPSRDNYDRSDYGGRDYVDAPRNDRDDYGGRGGYGSRGYNDRNGRYDDRNRDSDRDYNDRGFGDRDRGSGYRDRGYGDRDRGYGDRDRGYGDRDRSYGDRDRSYGDRDRSYGDRDRGYGDRDRGYGDRDRSYGDRDRGYGDRDRGFGDRDRGYGDRDRGYSDRDRGFGRRDFNSRDRPDDRDRRYNEPRDGGPPQEDAPRERPRLQLQKRTVPITQTNEPQAASSIFGGAKPVDTTAKERAIEEKLKRETLDGEKRHEPDSSDRLRSDRSPRDDQRSYGSRSRRESERDDDSSSQRSSSPKREPAKVVPAPPPSTNAWTSKRTNLADDLKNDSQPFQDKSESNSDRRPQRSGDPRRKDEGSRDDSQQSRYGKGSDRSSRGGYKGAVDTKKYDDKPSRNDKEKPIKEPPKYEEKKNQDFRSANKFAQLTMEDNDVDPNQSDEN